jgi:hypothetical protein
MTQRVTGQRFRQRKLSTKQNIPVLREHEIEKLDDDEASRHIPRVETGVEKGEEIVTLCMHLDVGRARDLPACYLIQRNALHSLPLE